jgi:hypothetical protein
VRRFDWRERFGALVASWVGLPFEWGVRDCGLLAVEVHDALTGDHLAERYRGKYKNALGARRFQIRNHLDAESVLREAGWRDIDPIEADAGDVVIVQTSGFACVHAVLGARVLRLWPGDPVGFGLTTTVLANPGAWALRLPG